MRRSPRKSKTPIAKKQQKDTYKSPQTLRIMEIKDGFNKQIIEPIKRIEQIGESKTPQRCLIHNTIYTLYCQFDRKPICASCMYQQQTHRKHKVVPIAKAINLIREDVISFQNKLEQNLSQCRAISRKLQEIIIRNQKFYPSVMDQLKKFYKGLIKMLTQKEKQQLQQVKQLQNKIQREVILLENQVKNIATFLMERLCPIKSMQTQEVLLTRRNIFEVLIKVNKVIHGELNQVFPDQENKAIIDFNAYNDMYQMVRSRLTINTPLLFSLPKSRVHSSKSVQQISPKNLKILPVEENKKVKKSLLKQQISSTNINNKQSKQVKFKFQ